MFSYWAWWCFGLGTTVLQSWNSFLGWILVYPFLGFLNLLDHGVFSECLEVIYWTTVFLYPFLDLAWAIVIGLTLGLVYQLLCIIFVQSHIILFWKEVFNVNLVKFDRVNRVMSLSYQVSIEISLAQNLVWIRFYIIVVMSLSYQASIEISLAQNLVWIKFYIIDVMSLPSRSGAI
jgi:hypothetical protein